MTIALAASLSAAEIAVPVPTGPHGVGRHLVQWTDNTRRMAPGMDEPRKLMVWIWYPGPKVKRSALEPMMAPEWASLRAEAMAACFGKDAAEAFRQMRVHAVTGAPLLPSSSNFPVLLFSPGFNWVAVEYSSLAEDLASHGYVVVGLTPTGFTGPVLFPNGSQVKNIYGPPDTPVWEQDLRFARGQLEELNAHGAFERRLDLAKLGVFGHSMGGAASLAVAAQEPSFRAALNLDGDPMNAVRDARPTQPVMLLSNEEPMESKSELELQGRIRSEKRRTTDWLNMSQQASWARRVRLQGTRHLDFADITLVPRELMTAEQRRYRFGPIAGARALEITRALVRGFFDFTLLGRPEPKVEAFAEVLPVRN
jgi:pimeloyl-ACP methyl ester carboxylesterase